MIFLRFDEWENPQHLIGVVIMRVLEPVPVMSGMPRADLSFLAKDAKRNLS
jgi:hypothetical protein